MTAKPTDKRTAVGRDPAASVQGKDVCALVADRRFDAPAGENPAGGGPAQTGDSAADAPRAGANASTPASDNDSTEQGRSNNDKGYQEAPDDRRRAPQDRNAADNPALLHRARSSAADAESNVSGQPDQRRR